MAEMDTRRALFIVLAVAWLAVGALSSETHGVGTSFWVFLSSMIAGSALAVVHWRTTFAVRTYALLVFAAGAISTVSLVEDGRYRAGAVWAVIVCHAVLLGWYVTHARNVQ